MTTKLPPGERLLASLRDVTSLAQKWAVAKTIARRRPGGAPSAPRPLPPKMKA